ncbi:hypothetical protein ACROYT_G016531 [Oculina patagonica]
MSTVYQLGDAQPCTSKSKGGKRKTNLEHCGQTKKNKKIKQAPVEDIIIKEEVVEEGVTPVLEEGEIFDPDEFLANFEHEPFPPCTPLLPPLENPSPPPLTRSGTEIVHYCPIHYLAPMEKRKTSTSLGEWEYLRCSETKFFNKCFVTCGADTAEQYLDSVKILYTVTTKIPTKLE